MNSRDRVWKWLEQSGAKELREGAGENIISSCPFHEVRSGTQFSINYKTGLYVCFSGSCGASGNIITFLVRALGWSFKKAIWAAEQFQLGEEIQEGELETPYDERKGNGRPAKEVILDESILGIYDFCPKYMLDRGFTRDLLRRWDIGFDYQSKRVTIPVRNELGQLVGFSKRGIFDYQAPKYLHLNFSKGEYVFGRERFLHSDRLWVTEGQLDTLALDSMEVPSGSTMGTRVSKKQISLMSKYKVIVLAFDNPDTDIDGRVTTLKIGEQLLKVMDPDSVFVPVYPRGIKDAGDLVRKSDKIKQKFLNSLVPFEDFRLRS